MASGIGRYIVPIVVQSQFYNYQQYCKAVINFGLELQRKWLLLLTPDLRQYIPKSCSLLFCTLDWIVLQWTSVLTHATRRDAICEKRSRGPRRTRVLCLVAAPIPTHQRDSHSSHTSVTSESAVLYTCTVLIHWHEVSPTSVKSREHTILIVFLCVLRFCLLGKLSSFI